MSPRVEFQLEEANEENTELLLPFFDVKKAEDQRYGTVSQSATTRDIVTHTTNCEDEKSTHSNIQGTLPGLEHHFLPSVMEANREYAVWFWRLSGARLGNSPTATAMRTSLLSQTIIISI